MDEFFQEVSEQIREHWVKFLTAAAFTIVGWILARMRAARDWKKREFFNRINFSLNSIVDGTLQIRTLCEKPCSEIFLNKVAVDRLIKSAQQTTETNPFVPVPQEDSWFYLNAVLNELSEQFAEGLLRRDAEMPCRAIRYVLCLTNESDGDLRTRKIRAMVIRRDLLTNLPKDQPKMERAHHSIRWRTLQQMQATLMKEPWRFIDVELVIGE
ncbi:MAG: hypothetical protein KDA85_01620 [Planctomycetaceae bacterium]|nr:hypothetical protein [Planctomycetaceae bacterium]